MKNNRSAPATPPDERLYESARHLAHARPALRCAISALRTGRSTEALQLLEEIERTWP